MPNTEFSGQPGDRGKRRLNDSLQDTGYSKEQYKRDAVLIQHIATLTKEEGVLPHLQSITQQVDRDMSNGVCFLMDKNTYDRYLEWVQRIVAEQANPTQDSNTWRTFCIRFRGGLMGKTIPETEMDGLDPLWRVPESPLVRYRTHMSAQPYSTLRLHISPSCGEEHDYIPGEDDENSNPEEWERHPQKLKHYQSNKTLGDRLRRLEDDNRRLTWIMESSDLYSHSRQASHYSSRWPRSSINWEPRWTEPRDPPPDWLDHEQS